ncbi:hypothetical protein [Mesobacillus persicus]|uniref:hypothetical protein n=1 Tax=Mesobacillus persicus TaxID=930146 RepID=UPI00147A22B9|nr:hypothetical protein [Mesobacillus persicus]
MTDAVHIHLPYLLAIEDVLLVEAAPVLKLQDTGDVIPDKDTPTLNPESSNGP